jgi:acyl-CoA hydrolase
VEIIPIITQHFVKNEDLNHHGTLFAGRTAEWFVESGLMAAASYVPANNIVCVKIHGMTFIKPIQLGEITKFISKVVYVGKTSLLTHVQLCVQEKELLNGFITFVNVDENGRPKPHGLQILAVTQEDRMLQKRAEALYNM